MAKPTEYETVIVSVRDVGDKVAYMGRTGWRLVGGPAFIPAQGIMLVFERVKDDG